MPETTENLEESIRQNAAIRRSVVSYEGKLTNQVIGEALNLPWSELPSSLLH